MKTFNFFSPYIKDIRSRQNKKIRLSLLIMLIVIVPLSLLPYYHFKIQKLEKEILQIESILQSRQNKEKISEIIEKEHKFQIMEKYYDILSEIDLKINSFNKINRDLLQIISSAVPPEVYFETLSLSSGELEIQGRAKDNISIAKFEHNLRSLGIFSSIHISTIHISADNRLVYDFSATCKLKDVNP